MNAQTQFAILSEQDRELSWKHPAAESRGKFYLIQGNKVIGRMRMSSARGLPNGMYEFVNVEPDDEATKAFFQDDFTIGTLGQIIGLRYDGITGRPVQNYDDEPADRHKGTEIVDSTNFDFGIAHPRHASVEGWANIVNRPKPRVHTTHRARRSRSSNKIKKVR